MIKRIIMVLLAVSLFGAVECEGAKKSSSKSARQKARRAKKDQKNKQQRIAFQVRRELRKIHGLQADLMRDKNNAERAKEYITQINSSLKKVTPHLKTVGNLPGIKNMTDLDKLVAEGKKLAAEPDKVTPETALELLQEKQLEVVEQFREKVSK